MNWKIASVLMVMVLACALAWAQGEQGEMKGDAQIIINGGAKDNVAFPHGLHQQALKSCSPCHDMFPKEKGAIQKLMDQKKIEKTSVMKMCIKCHQDRAKAGEKTGPLKCAECHSIKKP
jgi:hypothetical protein